MNGHRWILFILLIVLLIQMCSSAFQIPAAVAVGSFVFKYAYDKSYCKFAECCHTKSDSQDYIKYKDVHVRLSKLLNEKLFGQHLVNELLPRIIFRHLNAENPHKPMIISLHGWTGCGKTYTSKMVANAMFEKGIHSKFAKFLNSATFFAEVEADDMESKKKALYDLIKQQAITCSHSLIVIEEIDKMDPELVKVLGLFFNPTPQETEFNHLTFILLSNAGGSKIAKYVRQQFENGYERESIKLSDMEHLLNEDAFFQDGGLQHSDVISRFMIDHYIPILPLERRHVRQCIRKYLSEEYNYKTPQNEIINNVMAYIEFWPQDIKLYSLSGCKEVKRKVDLEDKKN